MSNIIKVLLTDIPLKEEHIKSLKEEGENIYVLVGPSQTTFTNDKGLAVPLLQVQGTRPRLEGGKGVPMLLSFNVTAFLEKMGAGADEVAQSRTAWRDKDNVEQKGYGHALGTDVRYDSTSDKAGYDLTYQHLIEWHEQVKGLLDANNRVVLRHPQGNSTGVGLFRPDLTKGIVEVTFSLKKLKNNRGSFFPFEEAVVIPNGGGLYTSLGSKISRNTSSNPNISEITEMYNVVVNQEDMPAPNPQQQTQQQTQQQGSPFVTF